jgi:hypothetical protein
MVLQGVRGALPRINLDEWLFRPAPGAHALLIGITVS